jgi:hypothetical protein
VPDGDHLFADVIVTMNEKARRFDGPRDSRWEFDAETAGTPMSTSRFA